MKNGSVRIMDWTAKSVERDRISPASNALMMNLSELPSTSLKVVFTKNTMQMAMIHEVEKQCGRISNETMMAKKNAGSIVLTLMNEKVSFNHIME